MTTAPACRSRGPTRAAMNVTVGLRVTDPLGAAGTTTRTVSVANTPPTVDITSPPASLAWAVGDTISFSATGTDAQDGPLPASAYAWTLTMRHCPVDCHSHIIETFTGVKTGSFTAPDHEYPSHLLLAVVVTDQGGLQAQDEVELFPSTGTVGGATSPAGIPITVGPATGTPPPAVTGIVNSTVGLSAPPTHLVGEATWTFDHWSDGGDRTAQRADRVQGTKTVTATYKLTGQADRSNTCTGSPAAVVPSGDWLSGKFGSANDVDWYRFKLTTTTRVRLVLGDLATPGRMTLYSGCSKALEVSDFGGLTPETDHPAPAARVVRSPPGGKRRDRHAELLLPDEAHAQHGPRHVVADADRRVGAQDRRRGLQQHDPLGRAGDGHGPALRCVGQVPRDADRPDAAVLHPAARTGAVQHRRLAAGRLSPQLPDRDRTLDVEVARHPDDLDQRASSSTRTVTTSSVARSGTRTRSRSTHSEWRRRCTTRYPGSSTCARYRSPRRPSGAVPRPRSAALSCRPDLAPSRAYVRGWVYR